MDPILTRDTIAKDYREYIASILSVRNPDITDSALKTLAAAQFVKGPYLEATPPFVAGKSLRGLITEGILSTEFSKIPDDIHLDRPLYAHQEQAIRKITESHQNIIVATGTGSGKTECYFYPIFNALMEQAKAGTLKPGVQALLLFPMNALANDQLKKLRGLLKNYPQITFGRYTGETSFDTEESARENYAQRYNQKPLSNEMLSRERMQQTPPHILLTNYAMLEYLLLRPADSTLFDGPAAENWRFIVIDEAHTYRGANGTEIALLLRRLKERIRHHSHQKLCCIATSATLGNEDAKEDLCSFAGNLFGERFLPENIITSLREKLCSDVDQHPFSVREYQALTAALSGMEESEKSLRAFQCLKKDSRLIWLHDYLKGSPKLFDDAAEKVFADIPKSDRSQALTSLVELATMAKPDENTKALLPARYHLFAKSLEGLFLSLYPTLQTYLDRKEVIPINGIKVPVFELANCQRCGQEYIVGSICKNNLIQINENPNVKPEYFLLSRGAEAVTTDADEDETEETDVKGLEEYRLCTACGAIYPAVGAPVDCCPVNDPGKYIRLYRISYSGQHKDVHTCVKCGSVSNTIIKRFLTANHAATYTLASSLYSMIPARPAQAAKLSEDDYFFDDDISCINEEYSKESGRKLLIFSDNRQEAAFFAGYMGNKYNQLMWRRLMLRVLHENCDCLRLDELIDLLVMQAEKAGLYENLSADSLSLTGKKIMAGQYVMYEFLGLAARTGLEGRGYVEFFPEPLGMPRGKWNLTTEETWNVLRELMDSLRLAGASLYPDSVDAADEFFSPKNRYVYFRKDGRLVSDKKNILSYIPAQGRKNKRLQYLLKLCRATGVPDSSQTETAAAILEESYKMLMALAKKDYFVSINLGNAGTAYMINFRKWNIRYIADNQTVYRCSKCGRVSAYQAKGICSAFKCTGTMVPVTADQVRNSPYYREQFSQDRIIPMVAREHTAQLTRNAAGDYQRDFEEGKINILSCSTTFEMGVDVGELEATFLRNVPPETANYIQRAGRAGRRTSSTAFSLTFSRRSSHDLNYFNHPEDIISGQISPPYVEIENDKIASRHINSVIIAWFFKNFPYYFSHGAEALVGFSGCENAGEILKKELRKHPPELMDALQYILPSRLAARMHLNDWPFIDQLVGEEGSLTKAIEERFAELEQLTQMKNQYISANKLRIAESVGNLISTYSKNKSIDFLASHTVLPKYGFPIDVVPLKILSNSGTARQVELTRDLRIAIAEYAPPGQIVANGKVWTSRFINTVPSKGWPTYTYYTCPKCGHISPPAHITVLDEEPGDEEEKVCPSCSETMKRRKFIIPIFGFSTSFDEKPIRVGDARPQHGYSTRSQFWGIGELDEYQQEQRKSRTVFGEDRAAFLEYSPNGRMVVLNQGKNGGGLWVCKACGHVQEYPTEPQHNNKFGKKCINTHLSHTSLGHWFNTDIVRIELPCCPAQLQFPGKDIRLSVLYAILDGAAQALGISRSDINGCIDFDGIHPAVILYDESAGGAGHVKKIYENIEKVFITAMHRVDGSCGCSEETSCYGCLRNYQNQYEHDKLTRGGAYYYLKWITTSLRENNDADENDLPF